MMEQKPLPSRDKVGEIYRLQSDQLSFQCSHCDDEFPSLDEFVEHIQTHLHEIFTVFIGPDGSTHKQDDKIAIESIILCQPPIEEPEPSSDIKWEPLSPNRADINGIFPIIIIFACKLMIS